MSKRITIVMWILLVLSVALNIYLFGLRRGFSAAVNIATRPVEAEAK